MSKWKIKMAAEITYTVQSSWMLLNGCKLFVLFIYIFSLSRALFFSLAFSISLLLALCGNIYIYFRVYMNISSSTIQCSIHVLLFSIFNFNFFFLFFFFSFLIGFKFYFYEYYYSVFSSFSVLYWLQWTTTKIVRNFTIYNINPVLVCVFAVFFFLRRFLVGWSLA